MAKIGYVFLVLALTLLALAAARPANEPRDDAGKAQLMRFDIIFHNKYQHFVM